MVSPSGEGNCISTVGVALPVRGPQLFYGEGGMQPVPPVSQWQAGFNGPPIT